MQNLHWSSVFKYYFAGRILLSMSIAPSMQASTSQDTAAVDGTSPQDVPGAYPITAETPHQPAATVTETEGQGNHFFNGRASDLNGGSHPSRSMKPHLSAYSTAY